MNVNIKKVVKENKSMVYSAIIALLAVSLVFVFTRQKVDRFIFIMPIFAGWILFNILMLPDEENEVLNEEGKKTAKDNT